MGKPTELLEQWATDEEGLIAVDDSAADAAEIIEERDQLEPPIVAGEPVHKTACLDREIGLHPVQSLNSPGWQDRIGMKEKKPLTCGLLGPGVHLGSAALWGVKHET